jgi:hypothetical protein
MVDGDWTITRSNGNIRYIGADHGVGSLVTTGALVVGTYYRIVSVGDSDFTNSGATSNEVGVEFESSDTGDGTTGEVLQVASYATVIEFHRWIQDFADDASSSGDDELDITDLTPSDRSTDNIITLLNSYNIDDNASEHLYDGSIIQTGGDEIYDGIVNFGNQEVMIQLLQSGGVISDDWWNYAESGTHTGGADASVLTDSDQNWFTNEWVGYYLLNTTDGSRGLVTSNTSTTITAVLAGGTDADWDSSDAYLIAKGVNSNSAGGISHRFMVKTRTAGADIDNRRLIGLNRRFGFTYGEFNIPATARGNNVLALSDAADLNNQTSESTVAGYSGITNTEGYRSIDVDGNGSPENYYSEWDTNQPTRSINDFYERMKYLTRDGETTTIYGIPGEIFRGITHEINIASGTGTWVEPESLSWGSGATAGTGQLLATDDTAGGSTAKIWMQLLSGVVPTTGLTITGNGAATGVQTGSVVSRAVSKPFVGASTGSALIGAYGLGVEPTDLGASDLLFDLTNTGVVPPNNVTFTVFGLISGEDRVLVTNDSTGIDFGQMALATALTGGTETSVDVGTGNIPTDTPQTGNLRIEMDDGRYRLVAWISHNADDTFTISSTSFTSDEAASTNNVFIGYIDKLATGTSETFTVVYNSDRTLFVRVRDGDSTPIKTFETTGTLGSSGGSATAIRTSDE